MKYFILAGEASGDLHSAALATALRSIDADAEISGWGGDQMKEAGVKILKHYRELAFMGFVEVLQHLPQIIRNFRQAKSQIAAFRPDVLILTDYPGFNLRMAKWAHRRGIPVHYYISPQLWAWKESRVRIVKACVDQMYVILPFEKAFYAKHGIDVHYVGHPLAWRIAAMRSSGPDATRKYLVLLPGSRRREIRYMLPVMLAAVKDLKGHRIVVAGAPSVPVGVYYHDIKASGVDGATVTFGYTYALLQRGVAALCTSGTATLETALYDVPQVVCYKGDRLSYLIARRLVKVPYIAMVNLICGREVVPECIQDAFNPVEVRQALASVMASPGREEIARGYAQMKAMLGTGDPSAQVARHVIHAIQNTAYGSAS
jgi:lipid-A-disaccharide synthase